MTPTKEAILQQIQEAAWSTPYDDPQLDSDIAVILRYHPYGPNHWLNRSPEYRWVSTRPGWCNFLTPDQTTPDGYGWDVPKVTSSLDAVCQMIEWALPGQSVAILRAGMNDVTDSNYKSTFIYCCLGHLMNTLIQQEQNG